MAWLDQHPPRRSQFRRPRRQKPSGVVAVHTAENTPDFVAFDGGAEAVARFIQTRTTPGSYHDLVDSDSCINLVDYGNEAFHDGTGTNPHSYGLSIATRADVWPLAPKKWRDGAIEQAAQAAARYAHWVKGLYGITIPARRITATQARARVPGFTSHGELDPTRRTDPGPGFPWTQFLERFADLTSQEDKLSAEEVQQINDHTAAELDRTRQWVRDELKRQSTTLTREIRAAGLDAGALAEELARRLPVEGPVSVIDLEAALRAVLGSLDD